MAKIISIHSFRGGTGKSNTTANLSSLIAAAGYRVAVVDTDIQSPGIHVLFQLQRDRIKYVLNDYLWGDCSIEQAAYDVTETNVAETAEDSAGKLFLVPSSISAGEIGRVLKEGYDVGLLNDGFKRLVRELQLDFLFIDTHPGVNEETLLSIAISDTVLLLMRPDSQDFQGTAVTLELTRRLEVDAPSLIINKVPPGMDRAALKQKVENSYDAPVLAMMPLNSEIVRLASGGIFVNNHPDHPFTQELHGVVKKLVE